jgi:cation diffusion facilitator CzcD-associated flavoprotein CzcO
VFVDYLIVGGGPGGMATADDLSAALIARSASVSVALIEARDSLGGNIRVTQLVKPPGYTGKLEADLRAQRINMLTLKNERASAIRLNSTFYFSPFWNMVNLRGRRLLCSVPQDHANANDPADVYETSAIRIQCF